MTTANEFLEVTLRPTLQEMAAYDERFNTPQAEQLLLMIACHESMGFKHIRQVGGPALSYFQIEPATLFDMYRNYLEYRPDKLAMIRGYERAGVPLEENLAVPDQRFAVVAARLILWRVSEKIPSLEGMDQEIALAHYAKKHWNTEAGKATASKYLNDYLRYKPEGYAE